MLDKHKVMDSRGYKVVKSNDLIQNARFDLSLQEQKIILYLISKIKPEDMELKEHTFEISDFCRICGIYESSGKNYKNLKETLKNLRDKSVWIKVDKKEILFAWIDSIVITENSGTVDIKLSESIKPYLLQLQEKFTQYELVYPLAMKSQYSVRLYELIKSFEYRNGHELTIDELKERLNAENYELFGSFRQRVLQVAVSEINEITDIVIDYSLKKRGRSYEKIKLAIRHKTLDESIDTMYRLRGMLASRYYVK